MSLAEPSGSSPPEKPPGRKTIWAWASFWATRSMDWAMSPAVRFLMTTISGTAPAWAMALAASYSQLVPGKTGMSTRGWGALIRGFFQLSLS